MSSTLTQHDYDMKRMEMNNILLSFNNTILISVYQQGYLKLTSGMEFFWPSREYFLILQRIKSPTFQMEGVFDEVYKNNEELIRRNVIKRIKNKNTADVCKKRYQDSSEEFKIQKKQHMAKIKQQYQDDITKGIKTRPKRKSYNKQNSEKVRQHAERLSTVRRGAGNPMWGRSCSEHHKRIKSELIKMRILQGIWTPHVHNSRTHARIIYNGRKYRSTWEALFQQLNEDYHYEQLRIPYVFENTSSIYIVDFISPDQSVCVEIKPSAMYNDAKVIAKRTALLEFCEIRQIQYVEIDETYFIDNYALFDFTEITGITRQKMRKINHEANKKGIYNKTFDCI